MARQHISDEPHFFARLQRTSHIRNEFVEVANRVVPMFVWNRPRLYKVQTLGRLDKQEKVYYEESTKPLPPTRGAVNASACVLRKIYD